MLVRKAYRQDATYWGSPTPDGFGGQTYDAPIAIKCRWEDKAEQFTSITGEIDVSRAIVFVPDPVKVGGYLLLGSSIATSPLTVTGAEEIRQIMDIPSIRNASREIRAFL